ncbi:hypothetical protein VNO80_13366 [Phaseolus coccineus]|uniref:Uncharacterized protein n=1 Tax=Phaseolus coccineus TaxID=3886 RepID=A0AAN9R9X3_PHACN
MKRIIFRWLRVTKVNGQQCQHGVGDVPRIEVTDIEEDDIDLVEGEQGDQGEDNEVQGELGDGDVNMCEKANNVENFDNVHVSYDSSWLRYPNQEFVHVEVPGETDNERSD